MGKKSSSSSDVSDAASVEGKYGQDTARDVTYADRPDQTNSFGSVNWTTEQVLDPASGEYVTKWSQNQELDPRLQDSLDSSLGFMGGKAALGQDMLGRIASEMAPAPNWGQFGDVIGFDPDEQRQAAEDAAYGKSTLRMDDYYTDAAEALDIKLRNQGLVPGDQSYDAQMDTYNYGKNDAYEQARLGSVAEGRDEFGIALEGNTQANALRNQQIQEYVDKRGFSLEEAEKLMAGQSAADIGELIGGSA